MIRTLSFVASAAPDLRLRLGLCLGLGLGLIAPAEAQSNVSVYGLADMSAGRFQGAGGSRLYRAQSGTMSTSFLGFRGAEDLGGSLKAVFAVEHYLRLDEGAVGRSGTDAFWARSAYVGLQGDFGTTQLGRNTTPLFVSTQNFNAFGDSFGFSPSMRQLFAPATGVGMLPFFGDTRWNNSLAYNGPDLDGLSLNLLANLGEGAPGANGRNIGASLLYAGGPFAATLAGQRVENGAFGTPPGFERQQTLQVGASYDLNLAKLFGQYTLVKTKASTDTETKIVGLGASVPLGEGRFLAQYGHASAESGAAEVKNQTLAVGYDHSLSKRTDVYAIVMNDKASGVTNGNTFALGLRARF